MDKNNQLRVKIFESDFVQIEIMDFEKWKEENSDNEIKIGSFLKIEDGHGRSIITLVKSFKMVESLELERISIQNEYNGSFLINTQPIGQITIDSLGNEKFIKGIKDISIPPNGVSVASKKNLETIFSTNEKKLIFSNHIINEDINIALNGDNFFSKHIAVVGSTGSGKSCTVAKILQEAYVKEQKKNNTHVVIFDMHGEYKKAFPKQNYLSIEDSTLILPYWLMNSEELEDLFIESNESNSHNQVSIFKEAVILNKLKHNPGMKVTYDSPVFFSLKEVFNYIRNKNKETHYINEKGEQLFATKSKTYKINETDILWEDIEFLPSSGQSKNTKLNSKVSSKSNGFYGEFPRFISRLENKINDNRLSFLLKEENHEGSQFSTDDLESIIKKVLGYEDEKNITIIDLSSLPFEIISIVVSIVSRIAFEFCYHATKFSKGNETPYLLVFEEAHKYVPKNNEVRYRNTRLAVERIAKEGRKYGISSMIVSQRPSELSATVFSQCNNFVVMRLNNPDDQSYVKKLLPEAVIGYGDSLSSLEKREALIVGDSVSTPCIAIIQEANPTPQSDDVKFYTKWQQDWKDIIFSDIMTKINRYEEM